MATDLDQLLRWGAAGLHVFPIQANGKRPMPGSRGFEDGTSDAGQIRHWHESLPGCNWGLSCGSCGIAVLDVDCKNGAPGFASLKALELEHGLLPETFTVDTPSGGRHYYFKGACPSSASKLGAGLDTRGAGGYVLLPGSTLDGKDYTVVAKHAVATLPAWISDALGAIREKAPADRCVAEHVQIDSPENVTRATEMLLQAEPAVEGAGGDATTLKVAMRAKDCGISEPTCADLMLRFWNPRCAPSWEPEDLAVKVRNAYVYGQEPIGSAVPPPPDFKPLSAAIDAALAPAPKKRITFVRASSFDEAKIKPRPWILGHQLIEGFITATVAKGGVGKTTISVAEALAVACGRPLTGDAVVRPGNVWIYNTEDPLDDLERRVTAAAKHHGLTKDELDRVIVTSGRTDPLVVAQSVNHQPQLNLAQIAEVVEIIKAEEIKVWVVDPFVHTHYCDENSNAEIAVVMQAFGRIAEATGCAVSLVHHSTKGAGGEGNMDKARGASAFGGAVRIMRTVSGMTEEDAQEFGIAESRRKWYTRMDDAKGNMVAPSEKMRWFEKISVNLFPSGDDVGTVAPVELTKVEKTELVPVRKLIEQIAPICDPGLDMEEVLLAMNSKIEGDELKGVRRTTMAKHVVELLEGSPLFVQGVGTLHLRGGPKAWTVALEKLAWLS